MSPDQESVAQAQELPNRVFVGNLTYQTRDIELKAHCEKAGKVVDCKIAFAGPRSLGFGFVAYETEAEMLKAIEILKDSELDGRIINVEKAMPKSERPAGERRPARGRGRGRGRGGRTRREPPVGEPSKTVVFVGNLPFNVVDEDLQNIFQKYQVVKAHVVRMRNGASKGFGFVTFVNEAEQLKAVNELTEVWCDERKLSIRPALSEEAKPASTVEHHVEIKA